MRKYFLPIIGLSLFTSTVFSQDILDKVPADAAVVIKYAGLNLSQKMPPEKFESYTILKKKLLETFKSNPALKLQDIGLNFQQDAYQYLTTTDSTTSFVTLLAVNNAEKFNRFVQENNKEQRTIQNKNGFRFYMVSANTYVGWSGSLAALVVTSYNSRRIYQSSNVDTVLYGSVGEMTPYADSSIALEQVVTAVDTAVVLSMPDSVAIASTDTTTEESAASIANRKEMEAFYQREALLKDSINMVNAAAILQNIYTAAVPSIKSNSLFLQLVNKNADISLWIDSTGLFNRLPSIYGISKFDFNALPGYAQAVNLFFEKDKVKVEHQVMYGNEATARSFKSVYNSKQNPSFVNYLRAGDLAHVSISVNTEALMNFYYGFMRKALTGMPYIGKETDLIDAYVDIMEIIIDEKAIANMLPGNGLFVLHALKPKQVEYIAYDYDANFSPKQTVKTKTEMSPDFSVIFETKNENIFNKLVNLPIKLNKDQHYNYTKTGDFYTLVLGEKNVIDKLYFVVKNGHCIISTSLPDIKGVLPPGVNGPDAATRQSFLNSNYSGSINFKSLVAGFASEVTDKKNKKMMNYLQANVNNLTFESSAENNGLKTTMLLNIAGKHNNSLEYFFNLVEGLLKIEAGEKK